MKTPFRALRRKLFAEGKLLNYASYAFGEVLLIVIGILIALQIGNWREERKTDGERIQLISNLVQDFEINQINLEKAISQREDYMENFDHFLDAVIDDSNVLSVREMKDMSAMIFTTIPFKPLLGSYETAISTGSINLIKSPNLNELLLQFEETYNVYIGYAEQAGDYFFKGGVWELRKELGSFAGFQSAPVPEQDVFAYSIDYYREFFKRKDVYSVYENFYTLSQLRLYHLRWLKGLNEDILTNLHKL